MKLKINYIYLTLVIFTKFIYSQNEEKALYNSNLQTVDKILAIIYHPNGSHLILQSDLTSSIDQITIPQEEVILRKLIEIDAEIMQVNISDDDIDRLWARRQKELNLTQEQLLEKIKPYTLEQAREELKKNIILQNMIDYRVRTKIIIDKNDIEKYYKENPIYQEASYTISQSTVELNVSSETIKKIKLQKAIESGEIDKLAHWGPAIEIKDSQIAADKAHIKNLNIGDIITFENNSDNSINLIKLISKSEPRLLEYKEREEEIYNLLYQEKFEKIFNEYKDKLFGQYEIESDSFAKDPRIAIIKYIN